MAIDGTPYVVVFPDGAGFNPGYRLAKDPIYPGIAEDFRRTHHFLEMLKPDIWLAQHNEYYDLAGKRERANTEGINAWIDPEGYRRFIAGKKQAFEDQVDLELGVKAPAPAAASTSSTAPPATAGGMVTLVNFIRAETDRYFAQTANDGAFGTLRHSRTMTPLDAQDVVRMIGQQVTLFDPTLLLQRQPPEHLSKVLPQFAVQRLPPTFRNEHDVVLAVPYRVIQTLDCVHQDASSRVLGGSRAKYRRWTHSLTRQTSTASPAEPGGLPGLLAGC